MHIITQRRPRLVGRPRRDAGDAVPVIFWQDWETLGEAREGGEDTEWRAYSPECVERLYEKWFSGSDPLL